MKRYLLDSDGKVVNVIILESDTDWTPPVGFTLAPASLAKAEIGGTWDGTTYTAPPASASQPDPIEGLKTRYSDASTSAEKVDILAEHLGLM